MPAPTITSVTPATGRTGGRVLVTITGTNFRVPPPPPATSSAPLPVAGPTVKVTFTSAQQDPAVPRLARDAERVGVMSSTQLLVVTPALDPGAADITVTNLDDAGNPVLGETTTAARAYTLQLPDLTAESPLVNVVRALLRDLKRQVLPNVALTTAVDFDGTPQDNLNIVEVAQLPAIVLVGPRLPENRFYSLNAQRTVDNGDGTFSSLRTPKTVDVEFDVLVVSESEIEALALTGAFVAYAQRNPYLRVPRDVTDATQGDVLYEMDGGGDMAGQNRPNESNIRQLAGSLVIRGVDLDEAQMLWARTATATDYTVGGASSLDAPWPAAIGPDQSAYVPPTPAVPGAPTGAGQTTDPFYQLNPPTNGG